MEKLNIAVVSGGDSPEYEISIKSGKQIAANIDRDKYAVYAVHLKGSKWTVQLENLVCDINKEDFSFVNNEGVVIKFDCVYITIHGTPGEDGKLQGYFDMLNVAYTSCSVLCSALTFDKYFCNNYLSAFGVLSAKSVLLKKREAYDATDIIRKTGIPCFVKPNTGGSSCATSRVNTANDLEAAIDKAFEVADDVIIEEFIDGTEITSGIIKTATKEYLFPITEIVSKNEFFDYDSKYNPDLVQEITPARISEELTTVCKSINSKIYSLLKCSGVVRMDYIIKNEQLYFLEVNTVPGMSENSLVPQQARAYGLSLKELYAIIIEDALARHKNRT